MPYLTPDSIPEDDNCRPLLIPASSDWLAIVSGALTELALKWNWQQEGAVTVDEAVARMQVMIDTYYDGCAPCTQPGGLRVIRIGEGGHVEQLDGDGTYVPATGDYYVPPPPAREGGTSQDQICLAAANAENVMHEIYDNLEASYTGGLNEAEALTALVEFLIVTLGAEFAPITYGLALLILSIFGVVYAALSYLFADLWDSNFTEAFKCMLVGCASNDAGVVTFDYSCVEHALYTAAVSHGIDETQLRLYGQINYILSFIGGGDALNTAGANTGIVTADCTDCDPSQCYQWLVTSLASELGWGVGGYGSWNEVYAPYSYVMSCVGGIGTNANLSVVQNWSTVDVGFVKLTHAESVIDVVGVGTSWSIYGMTDGGGTLTLLASGTASVGTNVVCGSDVSMDVCYGLVFDYQTIAGCGSGDVHAHSFSINGIHLSNISLTPNC